MKLSRRRLLGLGAAAAAAAVGGPCWSLGATPFGAIDYEWLDATRQRPVPARLYLPEPEPRSPHRVPLAVFSHGIGGTRSSFSWLGQTFAGHGIASLHLQHVGSDRQLWAGNPLTLVARLQAAAQEGEALARAHDLRFALDTLLAGEVGEHIDPRRIIAAGHSYGANTTLLGCGARVERQGRALALRDERIGAAILLSAPPFYGEGDPKKVLAGVVVPSLHVTATEDVIRIPGYFSGLRDRLEVFEAVGARRKWLAVYEGGAHNMLSDRILAAGTASSLQWKAATQSLVLAFAREVFDGQDDALAAWPRQHAALLARFSAGPA